MNYSTPFTTQIQIPKFIISDTMSNGYSAKKVVSSVSPNKSKMLKDSPPVSTHLSINYFNKKLSLQHQPKISNFTPNELSNKGETKDNNLTETDPNKTAAAAIKESNHNFNKKIKQLEDRITIVTKENEKLKMIAFPKGQNVSNSASANISTQQHQSAFNGDSININDLQKEIFGLREKLAHEISLNEKLKNTIEQMELKFSTILKQYESLYKENMNLKNQILQINKEFYQITGSSLQNSGMVSRDINNVGFQESHYQNKSEHDNFSKQVMDLKKEKSLLEDKVAKLNIQLHGIEKMYKSLQDKISKDEEYSKNYRLQAEAQIVSLNQINKKFQAMVSDLNKKLELKDNEQRIQNSKLEGDLNELYHMKQIFPRINSEREELLIKIQKLAHELSQQGNESNIQLKDLEEKLIDQKKEMNNLEVLYKNKESLLNELEIKLKKTQQQIKDQDQIIQNLTATNTKLERESENLKKTVQLNQQNLNNEIAEMNKIQSNLKSKIEILEDEKEKLLSQCKNNEKVQESLVADIQSVLNENKIMIGNIETLKKENATYFDKIKQLEDFIKQNHGLEHPIDEGILSTSNGNVKPIDKTQGRSRGIKNGSQNFDSNVNDPNNNKQNENQLNLETKEEKELIILQEAVEEFQKEFDKVQNLLQAEKQNSTELQRLILQFEADKNNLLVVNRKLEDNILQMDVQIKTEISKTNQMTQEFLSQAQELDDTKDKLTQQHGENKKLIENNHDLNLTITSLKSKCETIESSYKLLDKELLETNSNLNKFQEMNKKLEESLADIENHNANLKNDVEKLKDEKIQQAKKIKELESSLEDKEKNLKKFISKMDNTENKASLSQVDAYSVGSKESSSDHEDGGARWNKWEDAINEANHSFNKFIRSETQISALNRKSLVDYLYNAEKDKCDELMLKNVELEKALSSLTSQKILLETEIESLLPKLKILEEDNFKMNNENDELKNHVQQLEQKYKEQEMKLKELIMTNNESPLNNNIKNSESILSNEESNSRKKIVVFLDDFEALNQNKLAAEQLLDEEIRRNHKLEEEKLALSAKLKENPEKSPPLHPLAEIELKSNFSSSSKSIKSIYIEENCELQGILIQKEEEKKNFKKKIKILQAELKRYMSNSVLVNANIEIEKKTQEYKHLYSAFENLGIKASEIEKQRDELLSILENLNGKQPFNVDLTQISKTSEHKFLLDGIDTQRTLDDNLSATNIKEIKHENELLRREIVLMQENLDDAYRKIKLLEEKEEGYQMIEKQVYELIDDNKIAVEDRDRLKREVIKYQKENEVIKSQYDQIIKDKFGHDGEEILKMYTSEKTKFENQILQLKETILELDQALEYLTEENKRLTKN